MEAISAPGLSKATTSSARATPVAEHLRGLGSDELLEGVQGKLSGPVCKVMPLRQSEMTQPSLALQGIIASHMMPPGWRATTLSYLASGTSFTRRTPWR
jgi:hypothetical protein